MGAKSKKAKKKQAKEKKDQEPQEERLEEENVLDRDVKKSIFAVLIIMLALIFLLSLFGLAGVTGQYIDKGLSFLFGWGRFMLPLVMIVLGIFYFRKMKPFRYTLASVGAIMFYLMFLGLVHMTVDVGEMAQQAKLGLGGGYVGMGISFSLTKLLGKIAGVVILLGFALIGIMLIFNAPLNSMLEGIKGKLRMKKKQEDEEDKEEAEDEAEQIEEKSKLVALEPEKEEREKQETEQQAEEEKEQEEQKDDGRLHENIKSLIFDDSPEDELFKENEKKEKTKRRKRSNEYAKSNWQAPPLHLLQQSKPRPQQANLDETVEVITQTLENFDIKVFPGEYHVGPTVTQYTFQPDNGVKLSKIVSLQDNLSLALAATIRIEAPIPGKSLIGIEVPNKEKSLVRMRTMLESDVFKNRPSDLSVIFGEDVNGHPTLANIEKMPHMLIAGSTGTGKSVCINMILVSLLYQNSPEDLRLILVDPKRVELSMYNNIPHLLTPVIVDAHKVVNALRWAISEMEKRYRLLQEVGSRDIGSFNEKVSLGKKRQVVDKETGEERMEPLEKLPYIIIVIDELADIMVAHSKDVEGLIVRLAQMARAVGIHLIVSTQRPSVEVLTGLIKAQITTRVAFQVATQVDSRTILDMSGAEKLLGNGDMLFKNADAAKPKRVQGIFIAEQEVKKVVRSIVKQTKQMKFDDNEDLSESLEQQLESSTGIFSGPGTEGAADDELYDQAKELVVQAKKASTSMLQRRLKIGYSRAARIVDMLEENGVVGPADGAKPRELLAGRNEPGYEEGDELEDQQKRDKWSM